MSLDSPAPVDSLPLCHLGSPVVLLYTKLYSFMRAVSLKGPSHNWDPFVPGLLLMRTTGQSAPTGEKQEILLTLFRFLSLSSP